MSKNLDLVRSIYADLERGDFSRANWADPEIEVVVADGPEPGRGTGLAGMATGWREVLSAWEDFRVEVDDYREVDDERVLALIRFSGRGKTSGIEAGQMGGNGAALFHMREGSVTRMTHYWDRDRALADLGLKEQATSEQATTPDLVEVGSRLLEAANRRDLDAVLSFYAPDALLENVGALGTFEGVAAIRGFWQDWFASYQELSVEQEEALNLGYGVTFSVVIQKARLVGSSSEIRHRNAVVAVWVNGLIVGGRFYSASSSADIDEARAAAERLALERAQADV